MFGKTRFGIFPTDFVVATTPQTTPGCQHLVGRGWGERKGRSTGKAGSFSQQTAPASPFLFNNNKLLAFYTKLQILRLRFGKWEAVEVDCLPLSPGLCQSALDMGRGMNSVWAWKSFQALKK